MTADETHHGNRGKRRGPEGGQWGFAPKRMESILVVEDNPDVRRLVRRQLTELGYKVHEAGSGPEAIALLRSGLALDLMFTDIIMPEGMSGYELAGLARQFCPGLKILFTSGYTAIGAAQDRERCDVPLLSKPYRKSDLAHFIRAALDEAAEGVRLEPT
jgi:CheY-like chemotaxis protein